MSDWSEEVNPKVIAATTSSSSAMFANPEYTSTFAKPVDAVIVGDSYIIWGALLLTMVLANTWGCRHYLRSLDAATNSAAPTVVSAASSYVLSGVIGITLFEEASSVRWWAGAMLIVFGLALVAQPRNKNKEE